MVKGVRSVEFSRALHFFIMESKSIKYINSADKPTKKRLKEAIEKIPLGDVLYRVIVKFIPEEIPEPDEIEAILEGRKDRAENGTVPHEAINWD